MALSRRQFVGLTGGTLTGLAGCLDADTEFLVTRTTIIHQRGSGFYDYPEDVAVRVEIDNTTPQRQEGTVVVTLERTDGEGTVLESWTQRRDVSLSRGTNQRETVVFENVFEQGNDIDDYRVEGHIER